MMDETLRVWMSLDNEELTDNSEHIMKKNRKRQIPIGNRALFED